MTSRLYYIVLGLCMLLAVVQMTRITVMRHNIATTPPSYAIGPTDADLEVAEFIDYSCPFCQQAHPTIMEAVARDGKVRYLPKPLPSENTRAMNAALLAYAAGRQGKFTDMHIALITDFPNLTNEKVSDIGVRLGLNPDQFKADMADESLQRHIYENATIHAQLGTSATPTFLIGKKLVYVPKGTMPTVDDFLRMFNEAREQQ